VIQKINPKLVTHIKLCDLRKSDYVFLPDKYSKFLFWDTLEYSKGYYEDGVYSSFNLLPTYYIYPKEMKDIDGVLWYMPKIKIFAGKNIATKYFETYKQATDWWQENLPNVSIEI